MSPEPTGLGYDGSADIFCLIYKLKLKKLNNLIFLVSVQEQQQQQQAAREILILRHTKVHLSLSSARFQNTNVQSGLIFGYLCCSEYIVTFSFTFCGTEQEQNLFVLKKTHDSKIQISESDFESQFLLCMFHLISCFFYNWLHMKYFKTLISKTVLINSASGFYHKNAAFVSSV